MLIVSACMATNYEYSTVDIPDLIIQSISADGHVDWDSVDNLILLCEDREGLDVLSGCLDESSRVLRLETIPVLGWMAYRVIGDDPDSDLLFEIMSLLAPMIDVDDEEVQLAAIRAIETVLSSEIDLDSDITPDERLQNVSPNNKYFAICMRACVGGRASDYGSVRLLAGGLLGRLGAGEYVRLYDPDSYTFMTSVGDREYTDSILAAMPLTLEQKIEFRLDLMEYVASLMGTGVSHIMSTSYQSLGNVFRDSTPSEIADYLDHWSTMVRGLARNALVQLGEDYHSFITDAYSTGNARVRLELLEIVKPNATDIDKFELFDEVVHNPDLPVSFTDSRLFNIYISENEITSPDDYPIDIMAFLIRLLESDQGGDRTYAITRLGEFGPDAANAAPALIDLLQTYDKDFGPYFSWTLSQQTHTLGSLTALTLRQIGPDASDAIPYLIEMRENQPGIPEICATTGLYGIGYNSDEMVDWLVERLSTETDILLLPILVENLIHVGPDASDAVSKLIELSDHPDMMTRYYARDAIAAIEESQDTVIQLMIDRLGIEVEYDREEAAREFYHMADEADISMAIPAIRESLNDESRTVRNLACMTLIEYGGFNEEVVPVIIGLLELDYDQGTSIVRLLLDIGQPTADPAESAVLNMILGTNSNNIQQSILVYKDLWGVTDRLIDTLLDLAMDFDNTWYFHGFNALGEIGADAASTLPTLRTLLDHENRAVRESAQRTVDSIESAMEND